MTSSVSITAADLAPIPFIERCDYNEFIAQLARRHGESYLCRPDGTLLDGVVTVPEVKPKHQPKRQAPTLPATYTGNPMDDFQPQMRGITVMVEYERPDGSMTLRKDNSVKNQVLAALKDGPKTLAEIVKATGLVHGQVKNMLHRYNGTLLEPATDRAVNNQWRLTDVTAPQAERARHEPTIRERIEQHIAQHGPTSTPQLSAALGVNRDTVYATCHAAATLTVVAKANEKVVLWGLTHEAQLSKAA